MDWRILSTADRIWENRIAEAAAYHTRNGSLADLPLDATTSTGGALGHWVYHYQRLAAAGELPSDRIQQLSDLGVKFT
jgi:hypothetical protein